MAIFNRFSKQAAQHKVTRPLEIRTFIQSLAYSYVWELIRVSVCLNIYNRQIYRVFFNIPAQKLQILLKIAGTTWKFFVSI